MEDRYLCKARPIGTRKQWVTGFYAVLGEKTIIIEKEPEKYHDIEAGKISCGNEIVEVMPETVCQCTGLKDKNGNLIWENDILHNGNYFVVKWNAPCVRFDIVLNNSHNIPMRKWEPMICDWKTNDFKEYRKAVDYEVIGNMIDNPELLEV